jgi:hypothetical protein
MRSVHVDGGADFELVDPRGEVAERFHGDLDVVALGARRERERMQGEGEG